MSAQSGADGVWNILIFHKDSHRVKEDTKSNWTHCSQWHLNVLLLFCFPCPLPCSAHSFQLHFRDVSPNNSSPKYETWIISSALLERPQKNTGNRFIQTECSCKIPCSLLTIIYCIVLPLRRREDHTRFILRRLVFPFLFHHFPLDI